MRCAFRLTLFFLLFLFAAGTLLQRNFVINTTESFPRGIYRKEAREFRKGDLVLVCPPDRPIFHDALGVGLLSPGLCPGGLGYLIKQVAAIEGDFVEISSTGVTINGEQAAVYPAGAHGTAGSQGTSQGSCTDVSPSAVFRQPIFRDHSGKRCSHVS